MEITYNDSKKTYQAETTAKIKQAEILEVDGERKEVYPFVLTSETIDRDGDIIQISGLDYKNYLKNPVVFADHETNRHAIGNVLKIEKKGKKLIGYVHFHELDEESQLYKRYVDAKVYRAGSIGFRVYPDSVRRRATTPEEKASSGRSTVFEIQKAELYEFSIVKIPANPEAVLAKSFQDIKQELVDKERAAKKDGLLLIGDNLMEDLTIEQIKEYYEKRGAVLSKANRKKLENARDNIQAVLGQEEDEKAINIDSESLGFLTEAVKELQAQNEELKKELKELREDKEGEKALSLEEWKQLQSNIKEAQ